MVKRMVEKDFCDICDTELENLNHLCEECGKQTCPSCFTVIKLYKRIYQIGIEDNQIPLAARNVCNECYNKADYTINIKTKEVI